MKNIPTPKVTIKDHKIPNKEVYFPRRRIVPGNNFTFAFTRLGYLESIIILNSNQVKYEIHAISQALSLKKELEKLEFKKEEVTIAKLDIIATYPSIQLKLVWKAINH